MKKMVQIPEVQKNVRMTTAFSGYNHADIINDGEMYDTVNLSGDLYPALTPRTKRGVSSYDVSGQSPVALSGIHGRDQLVFVRGTEVFYNFVKVTGLTVSDSIDMVPKKIVSMGAYVCIWPDKVYFNTVDLSDKGSMERRLTLSGVNMTASLCRGDGTDYDMTAITVNASQPADPENGALWIDQSGDSDVLRQYNEGTDDWVEVPTVYIKIGGTGIGSGLKEYDAVDISGIAAPDVLDPDETYQRVINEADSLNGSTIIYAAGENYIVVAGILSQTLNALKDQEVTVNRTVPDLDYICESNNRLWGCKYGLENDVVVNEIRASKLGDFRNWQCFMGLSTDSYTASIGTDGQWTGAISQRGYPVFFKENAIHRVSGTTPGTFSIQTTTARGVQKGSWRSVCVVNENIYYKSRDGVMLYDGNMPVAVGEQLGSVLYSDARAGALKDKYYISMKDAEDHWSLFTYDTKRGIWYKEDALQALGFGTVEDELFIIDEENNTLLSVTGSVGTQESAPEWMAVFGISGVEYAPTQYGRTARNDLNGAMYISRFDIRMFLEEGQYAKLEIMYDDNGIWTEQGEIRGKGMKSFLLPVIPKRCDHLRVRMKGRGAMKIFSIARYLEVGSDA